MTTRPGQFANGTSGNPAGWPLGSRNKARIDLEQLFDGESETISRVLETTAEPDGARLIVFTEQHGSGDGHRLADEMIRRGEARASEPFVLIQRFGDAPEEAATPLH